MGLLSLLIIFVVEVVVVGAGIYVGAGLVVGEESYPKAFVTAFAGVCVLTVVQLLVGWIPLLGTLAALVAYLGVIRASYDAGWLETVGIAVVAWLSLNIVSLLLGALFAPLRALGI